jgi:hypothetical protein
VANKIDEIEERLVSTREGKQAAEINNDFFMEISVKEMARKSVQTIIINLHDKMLKLGNISPKGSPKVRRRKSVEMIINRIDVLISDAFSREFNGKRTLNSKKLKLYSDILNFD